MSITDEEMHKAVDLIARTPEGLLLFRWLQRERMRIARTVDPGALQILEGRRSLAADLMGHMAKGIDECDGRAEFKSDTGGTASERAVTFAGRKPVAVARRSGRRRITADTAVPGWDDAGPGKA